MEKDLQLENQNGNGSGNDKRESRGLPTRDRLLSHRPVRVTIEKRPEWPYDHVQIVGPIVIDLTRKIITVGMEYELMGHVLHDTIAIVSGPRRIEEPGENGKVRVTVKVLDDFDRVWENIKQALLNGLMTYITKHKPAQRK